MFLGYNLSLLTPFATPDALLLSKSTGYNLLPFLARYLVADVSKMFSAPTAPPVPALVCVFEIELSVVCGGAFLFFMLFMGKVALYDGGFPGFLCIVHFSRYYFSKSQAFICGVNCIFFMLCFVYVLFIMIAR